MAIAIVKVWGMTPDDLLRMGQVRAAIRDALADPFIGIDTTGDIIIKFPVESDQVVPPEHLVVEVEIFGLQIKHNTQQHVERVRADFLNFLTASVSENFPETALVLVPWVIYPCAVVVNCINKAG